MIVTTKYDELLGNTEIRIQAQSCHELTLLRSLKVQQVRHMWMNAAREELVIELKHAQPTKKK